LDFLCEQATSLYMGN